MTGFPSATHLCLTLGADSPCADERCAGNLGLSAREPFTPFIATHVSIRTSDTSSIPHETPSQAYRTLSYHLSAPFRTRPRLSFAPQRGVNDKPSIEGRTPYLHFSTVLSCVVLRHLTDFQSVRSSRNLNALKGALKSAASVHGLSPVTSSAQDDSISELLRFL